MCERTAFSCRTEACSLTYLQQREQVRLKRLRRESQQDAAPDDIFRSVRLCCAHRQHDPPSVTAQRRLSELRALGGGGDVLLFAAAVLWGFGGLPAIAHVVFFFGWASLLQAIGSRFFSDGHVCEGRSFLERLSMENFRHLGTWTVQSWAFVVEAALACWEAGEYAFTDAYQPSRCFRVEEARARRTGRAVAEAAYSRRCGELVDLWLQREALAAALNPMTAWRVAARHVSEVRGFGGTGFAAKELVFDPACQRDLSLVADFISWCPVGPGARRATDSGQQRLF